MAHDTDTILIDGSEGEGGGQILRTSLSLACIAGRPLRIENIRAARRNPGLARQHLSCVRAACKISAGECDGAALGSRTLYFRPGPVRGGDFSFDIRSAGSASLVIQTVLPALFTADATSTITVTGGTHNPLAPPFDFIRETFLPAVRPLGFGCDASLLKHGFFPAGGGKMTFRIEPSRANARRPIDLCTSDQPYRINARIYLARLPEHIARRQEKLLLRSPIEIADVEHVRVTDSNGPGNCVMVRLCGAVRTTVFTAFGMRGRPSEQVVEEVVDMAGGFLQSDAAVDRFLADQLLIYMALSGGGRYTTNELSNHLLTNIETIKKFLPVDFKTEERAGVHQVSCLPA
ncbi:MAG: RNA 3'-terminal phosphate cyclase [Phycisphaerales bacterium]|nr:MAG: RNA 3'-terminal phosphate cyclase [Phycisphaerales bacterium]